MTATAAELYERALADSNGGRLAAARRGLDRAARAASDPDLRARIVGTVAYLAAETGDPDTALELSRQAAARPDIGAHTRAVLIGQIGLIEMRRGDAEPALEHLGAAMARLAEDRPALGRLALNRGNVHLQRGDLRRAAADFATAREAFRAAGLPVDEAKARHNEGYTALLVGDLVTAIRGMDGARSVLAAVSPVLAATCDLDRAEALLAAGMPDEAAGLLASAARSYGTRRLWRPQAEAELLLARTLSHSAPREAAAVARRAAKRFRAHGNEAWALRADGWALHAAATAGDPVPVAELDRLADRLRATGARDDAHRLRLEAAAGLLRSGDLGAAAGRLRGAAPPRSAPIATRLLAREVRADLAAARGDLRAALRTAGAGLDELTRAQAALGSLDLQSSLVLHARPLLLAGVETAIRTGDPETVFTWSERARNLVARVPSLQAPGDRATAADLAEVRRLRAFGPEPGEEGTEAELLRRLRERLWHERGEGAVQTIAPLVAVQSALGRVGGTAVALLWTGRRTAAVVTDERHARVVGLGACDPVAELLAGLRADLDMAASAVTGALRAGVEAALAARLAALDDRLIRALGPIGDGPLVISLPGALAGLPWGMLPSLRDRPITVATSLTEWTRSHRAGFGLTAAGFAAGPRVARADEEVSRASRAWRGAVVLRGDDADCASVAALAGAVEVLHLSAHGRHSAEQPLFSAVELADGPWFGYEVHRLARVPPVVILSACEVGRSAVRWGQESMGMARSWLHAGARSVIASPVSVADDVACEALPALHERLRAGLAPAPALAASGAAARGSFLCFGDG